MDFWEIASSAAAKEFTATGIVIAVVIAIFTGIMVPGRTHKREIQAANTVAESHRIASEKKDELIASLADQNHKLIAGIRIANAFYADFLEDPTHKDGGQHVGP